jgi:hypothetical protein
MEQSTRDPMARILELWGQVEAELKTPPESLRPTKGGNPGTLRLEQNQHQLRMLLQESETEHLPPALRAWVSAYDEKVRERQREMAERRREAERAWELAHAGAQARRHTPTLEQTPVSLAILADAIAAANRGWVKQQWTFAAILRNLRPHLPEAAFREFIESIGFSLGPRGGIR